MSESPADFTADDEKLSVGEKIGYGLGDTPSNVADYSEWKNNRRATGLQSERTLDGIIGMMSLIPAAFLLFSAFFMLFYRLDRNSCNKSNPSFGNANKALLPANKSFLPLVN